MHLNSNTLKLAYLLAQYLYTNKRLDLPGIGTFTLYPSPISEAENTKQKSSVTESIRFENNPSLQDATDLVNYISAKSGKMKPLASSDLDSHIQLAQQFLNIGKPYTFEGIGSLVKVKPGEFEFTSGIIIAEKIKETSQKDVQGSSKKENADTKYESFLSTPATPSQWRKPVITLLIIIGIGLAILGGYVISTKNSENNESNMTAGNNEQTIPVTDTSLLNKLAPESIEKPKVQPDNYKYVLEVAKAGRAFRRFKTLKDSKLSDVVQLETKDSVQYKLFVLLPVSSDTTRVIDSLTEFLGKKVYIEHQNN